MATFDKVVRYEFGRLRQNGSEIAQPASPVVKFTLTNHMHLSLMCGEAGWGQALGLHKIFKPGNLPVIYQGWV